MRGFMDVSIIGTGYVGLISGLGLAKAGHNVLLVDKRGHVLEKIMRAQPPFYEPGLQELLTEVLESKRLSTTTSIAHAISKTELTLVCVGTPSRPDGSIDLSDVSAVAQEIGNALKQKTSFHAIIIKSTVVPGTTHSMSSIISAACGKTHGDGFGVGMNPEFLREGNAIEDALNPDRIVLGADDEKTSAKMAELYSFSKAPLLRVNTKTAEMIKYANNSFLALCISYSNEIAQICEKTGGINAYDVMKGVTLDGRLASNGKQAAITSYLAPGCGFGGSCFPKDVKALRNFSQSIGHPSKLIGNIMEINESQISLTIEKLQTSLKGLFGKKIAVLGVAFKPDTDDIRESPSLKIIERLLASGSKVSACDPQALENARKVFGDKISYCASAREALKDADAAILATKWQEFKKLAAQDFKSLMKNPLLLDCRGFYNAEDFSKVLQYELIGYRKG
ncbi:UDP-glucose 6-dehydrogenase AglM [Candidatus Anstonella stagnisolia]|nr:UDP-glucose 6-dehydrogenase AglM [Candidatus Anstonella stagnisolia]